MNVPLRQSRAVQTVIYLAVMNLLYRNYFFKKLSQRKNKQTRNYKQLKIKRYDLLPPAKEF